MAGKLEKILIKRFLFPYAYIFHLTEMKFGLNVVPYTYEMKI